MIDKISAASLAVSYEAYHSARRDYEAGDHSKMATNSLYVWTTSLRSSQKECGVELVKFERLDRRIATLRAALDEA